MTETTRKTSRAGTARRAAGIGPIWKSGMLATALSAVMLGWMLLVKAGAPTTAQIQPPLAQVSVLQVPGNRSRASAGQVPPAVLQPLPSLPQQPLFSGPITRTRRS